ncbi:MAG: methyltransferase domain-containing protein [Gemmatimonas sp.]|nr:methyltransferase domain-containing protein [Gemmatimonas sp.]
MNDAEAIAFIRDAVGSRPGAWADLGAGTGTFTKALVAILGESGSVVAVDRDPGAVAALQRLARADGSGARITGAAGDLDRLTAIPELEGSELDGVLFANSLHYLAEPEGALRSASDLVHEGGRVVIIEYERERSNPWVPHPLPLRRLRALAERAGLQPPEVVARRPSAYQGELYCAVAFLPLGSPR